MEMSEEDLGIALVGAVVAFSPSWRVSWFLLAKGRSCHKHDAHEEVIGVGAGALAGAVVGWSGWCGCRWYRWPVHRQAR